MNTIGQIMRQISLTIILCIFTGLHLYPQETGEKLRSIDVHLMPLTLIDYTPRTRIGFEIRSNGRTGYCLELGYGNYLFNRNRLIFEGMEWDEDYKFFEIRPELKYYFNSSASYYNFYFALEAFLIHMTDQMHDRYFHKDNSENTIEFDRADFNKNKFGLHLKGGLNTISFKRLILDFYCGK